VYDAIPTVVTAFVAVFAKISIFILLLELVHYTTNFFASLSMSGGQGQVNYLMSGGQEEENSLFNFS
jgi:hypothetical protein